MQRLFVPLNEPAQKWQSSKKNVVILSVNAFKKIRHWTIQASRDHHWETSGLGTVTLRHGGLFINDAWLLKPEKVGAANVDQDPASIAALMSELYTGTGEPRLSAKTGQFLGFKGGKDMKNLRLLWHTHNDFGVGWSGTDDQTAKFDFCPDSEWTLNICTNRQGHFVCRQDFPAAQNLLKAQGKHGSDLTVHNLPLVLLVPVSNGLTESLGGEFVEKHEKFIGRQRDESFQSDFNSLFGGLPVEEVPAKSGNGSNRIAGLLPGPGRE
jgi:hypothetical protein